MDEKYALSISEFNGLLESPRHDVVMFDRPATAWTSVTRDTEGWRVTGHVRFIDEAKPWTSANDLGTRLSLAKATRLSEEWLRYITEDEEPDHAD